MEALVVIEHHMDLIMSIADRIVMIDQGAMLATGTPAEIQRDPTRARSLSGARRMTGVLECEDLTVRYAGNVALVRRQHRRARGQDGRARRRQRRRQVDAGQCARRLVARARHRDGHGSIWKGRASTVLPRINASAAA